jgi:hypothetical protein
LGLLFLELRYCLGSRLTQAFTHFRPTDALQIKIPGTDVRNCPVRTAQVFTLRIWAILQAFATQVIGLAGAYKIR